jgi:gliding motility-associated-like protein
VSTVLATLSGATTAAGLTTLANVDFNLGTTTVLWTVTDGTGNTSTCSFDVVVNDNILPAISSCGAAGNQSVDVDPGQCNYTKTGTGWNAIATDNCTVSTVLATLSGATTASGLTTLANVDFNLGTTTVLWTVTDGTGNTSTCSFDVVVNDNQSPTFSACGLGGNQTATTDVSECTYQHQDDLWNAQASDLCSSTSLAYALSGATSGVGTTLNGQVFNTGVTTIIWTATDGSGNTSTCSFSVRVSDNEAPRFTSCSSTNDPIVFSNTGLCTYTHPSNSWNAIVTDNCTISGLSYSLSGATSGTGTSLSGQTFNLGQTTVVWTATDLAGNTMTCSFDVTVLDNQAPTILSCSGSTQHDVTTDLASCNYIQPGNSWDATASDNCQLLPLTYSLSGATTGTGTTLAGTSFNLGTTNVTWTATDPSGNSTTCTFTVVVTDRQAPIIVDCGTDQNHSVSNDEGSCNYVNNGNGWDASVTDNCTISSGTSVLTGATSGTFTSLDGVTFNQGVTHVNWIFTDQSGNSASCSFDVTVNDNENPSIINCPGNILVSNDAGQCGAIVTWEVPSVSDNCAGQIISNFNSGGNFPVGNTTVQYTATDDAGNSTTCSFIVTVEDNEVPAINCIGNISSCDPHIFFSIPTAQDNCGIQSILQTTGLSSGSYFPVGLTVVTFEATDINGNTSICSFNVTINPTPIAGVSVSDISCHGYNNGAIDLTMTNGTAPYTFSWSNGSTIEDPSGLPTGEYFVAITDYFGCTTNASGVINEPSAISLQADISNVKCHDGNNGSAALTVSGGSAPYNFIWSDGQTNQTANALSAGNYLVIVTDTNGCAASLAMAVYQPDTLVISTEINAATCTAANGSITPTVDGGTLPYAYNWSNGDTTEVLSDAAAGTYTLILLDGNGCVTEIDEIIPSVSEIAAESIVQDVKCYGDSTGTARLIIANGLPPYLIEWSNGDNGISADSLSAGTYQVSLEDNNGCTSSLEVQIEQPDPISLSVSTSQTDGIYNISENGACDGWIEVTVSGGTPDYEYVWSTGGTTNQESNLCAGTYSLIVTDYNGCSVVKSVTMKEPMVLEMPNGYSPNNDGDNDAFVVHGLDAYHENEIIIFNRWGNIVYQKEHYMNDWQGENTNGEPLPDATYFAILTVKITSDKTVTLTGYVDLRRK